MSTSRILLVLNNLRSVHNVGSLFRTADAVGVEKIYLVGITPTPLDRFGRVRKDFAKTALGAEHTVSYESVQSFSLLAKKLKKEGATLVALECGEEGETYSSYVPTFPLALVLGTEVDGLSQKELKLCDAVIEIPMKGKKESLNVSVAGAVALFNLRDR